MSIGDNPVGSGASSPREIVLFILTDLVDLICGCGIMTLQERGIEDDVRSGRVDVPLVDLDMDSLALMEFCIELESRWAFSVEPSDLARFGTLGELAALLGSANET